MMSTCFSKHVESWNKHIEKECIKLVINQNYVEMHGQQNIKLCWNEWTEYFNIGNIEICIWRWMYNRACSAVLWYVIWYDMIYLLIAIGLLPAGSSTIHIYTQTIHRATQNKQYIEQHKIGLH